MKNYKNILIIKLSAFGDFLFAIGPMQDIRKKYPEAKITLLTTSPFEKMAQDMKIFDKIIIDTKIKFNFKKLRLKKHKLNAFKRKLQNFDLVVDLQDNDRTHFYYWFLFPFKKPDWCGNIPFIKYRIDKKYRKNGKRIFNAFNKHKNQLYKLEIKKTSLPNLSFLKSENFKKLKLPKKYAVLVAGCSPAHPEKKWSPISFARLGNCLIKQGYSIVLVGTNHDKKENNIIKQHCPKAINLTNKTTIEDLAEIGKNASLCIANDTGPAIMMAITGVKTLILYSHSSMPEKSLPPAPDVSYLRKNNLNDLSVEEVIMKLGF